MDNELYDTVLPDNLHHTTAERRDICLTVGNQNSLKAEVLLNFAMPSKSPRRRLGTLFCSEDLTVSVHDKVVPLLINHHAIKL
jgi:hypothetical protein